MRRRDVTQLLGATVLLQHLPVTALAADPVRRIGWVEAHRERGQPSTNNWREVAEELRLLGWTRGGNVRADIYAPTNPAQFATLAQEIVKAQPDLIVTTGTPATLAILT